jgi:CheY-like chemotaxis protein
VSEFARRRILVLESNEPYRRYVVRILLDADFEVLEARDFASAMALVEGAQRIDLLLAAIGMPAKTPQGMSIARMSLMRRHALKIIYMTASDAEYCARYADEVVLQKPFTGDVLIEAVRASLSMRMSSSMASMA